MLARVPLSASCTTLCKDTRAASTYSRCGAEYDYDDVFHSPHHSPPSPSLCRPGGAGGGHHTPTRPLRLATNRRCSPAEGPHVEHTLTPRSAPLAIRTLSTMVMKTRRETADKAAANRDARRLQVLPPMSTADKADLWAKLLPNLRG